ncbi:MAG: hypothetical protein K9J37_06675 [Saprospiraceae bacterium]|nr:hypothetical protein [Saprospiraceae bacterium]MCF8249578.1 hypothetical protein [Saprospiraceae bacterium]MCF8280478.1 hypothetical protein [Bacteroidales bacterium]MCF8310410.1 hypothetical protein [Saprospiraceae bacterium]MCF8439788.1 hypothetical protein [Saprospiraceae bacterium]
MFTLLCAAFVIAKQTVIASLHVTFARNSWTGPAARDAKSGDPDLGWGDDIHFKPFD